MCMSSYTKDFNVKNSNSFVDKKLAERKIEYGTKPDLITEKQSAKMLKNTLSI